MTTHDIGIELPPLPEWADTTLQGEDRDSLFAWARAAIEADRKRRGEPSKCPECSDPDLSPEKHWQDGYDDGVAAALRRGEPVAWIRVAGDRVIASRRKWIYPQSTDDYAGTRDERRYAAIGGRDGDIVVFNTNLAETDLDDLKTMLAWQVSPQPADPRLDAPAQVGPVRFGIGVKWSTVIRAAQRHHEYMRQPDQEQARMKKFGEAIKSIQPAEPVKEQP